MSATTDSDKSESKKYFSSRQRFSDFRKSINQPTKKSNSDQPQSEGKLPRSYYLKKYREWLWPHKFNLLLVFTLALASMLIEMLLPWATKYIIDDILLKGSGGNAEKMRQLNIIGFAVFGTLVAGELVQAYRTNRMTILNSQVVFSLRKSLFDRLIQMPLSYINDLKSGGIVSRLSSDVENVTGLVQMAFISPGVAIIKVVVTLGILISIRWELALVAAALLPILTYFSVLWVKKAKPVYK